MKKDKYYSLSAFRSVVLGVILFSSMMMPLNAQTLTVQTPNGGEVWTYGQAEIISWTGNDLSDLVGIEFSIDGGTNWWFMGNVNTAPNGGTALLSVPNVQTENARLKIYDAFNPTVADMSDESFTVVVPPIIIYNPAEGSTLFNENSGLVSWEMTVSGISLLNAELSNDNGQTFIPIAENISASVYYTYLYFSIEPSDSCILKLSNTENPSQFGLSGVFSILAEPVYSIISPAEGQLVNAESPFTITWTVENPYSEYCYLEYSVNNGQTWEIINNAMNQGNSGSYEWLTPNISSEECLVRITDSYALNSSDSSGLFTIFPFPETPVCMVTVDSLTNHNMVIWEKPVSDIIDRFLVYKETDEANVYEVIDTVSYSDLPVVTDLNSNPAMRPYRYKIGFIDTENRLFPAGDYHQTIHLTISQGVNDSWNLIWTPYIGFDYASYKIMRKSDSGDYEQIATVSASFSSYTDFNAPPGEVFYMIKIEHPDGCNPANRDGEYASVNSNVASNSIVSVSENKTLNFTVYPIPAHKQLNVSFGNDTSGRVGLSLSNLAGEVIYSRELNDVRAGIIHPINTIDFKPGMYLVRMTTEGKSEVRKIVIQH